LARDGCCWSASHPGHFNNLEERLDGPVWTISTRSQSLYPACNQNKIPRSSSPYPNHFIAYSLRVRCNILLAWYWRRITRFEQSLPLTFWKAISVLTVHAAGLNVVMAKSFRWLCWYADGHGNTERFKNKVSLWIITRVFPKSIETVSLKLFHFLQVLLWYWTTHSCQQLLKAGGY